MKPVIGLTSSIDSTIRRGVYKINSDLINIIEENGAIPIVLPNLETTDNISRYIEMLDGIIFTGGDDIAPQYFGEEPLSQVTEISLKRDRTELALFKEAYEKRLPIMGICRGAQVINVGLGGNLYQDIYSQVEGVHGHTCESNLEEGYHTINIEKDTMTQEIFGAEKLLVNSLHHQSIKDLGDNLIVAARSLDGIIEAVESTEDRFILGLQFHPEVMAIKYQEFLKPFTYFLQKCRR